MKLRPGIGLSQGLITFLLTIALSFLVIGKPLASSTCLKNSLGGSLSQRGIEKGLTREELNRAFQTGESEFLDKKTGQFHTLLEKRISKTTGNEEFFLVKDQKGRKFVFKKQAESSDYKNEFLMLQYLQRYKDIVPDSFLVKRGDDIYLGTEYFEGINIKEITALDAWRTPETKGAIEKMLGETFKSEEEAIKRISSLVSHHPSYDAFLDRVEDIFTESAITPEDFQFMFHYDKATKKLKLRIIDPEKYEIHSEVGEFEDGYQGIDFIDEQLP